MLSTKSDPLADTTRASWHGEWVVTFGPRAGAAPPPEAIAWHGEQTTLAVSGLEGSALTVAEDADRVVLFSGLLTNAGELTRGAEPREAAAIVLHLLGSRPRRSLRPPAGPLRRDRLGPSRRHAQGRPRPRGHGAPLLRARRPPVVVVSFTRRAPPAAGHLEGCGCGCAERVDLRVVSRCREHVVLCREAGRARDSRDDRRRHLARAPLLGRLGPGRPDRLAARRRPGPVRCAA